jgi:3-hydroxyacyl-[acyl-carrier-protein] dehydratase
MNKFGPDLVQLLLPQRRPFLMVDRIDAFSFEARSLRASRFISANEEVFAGHFPGWSVWPGVLTIEGLGQSSQLLGALLTITAEHGPGALEQLDRIPPIEKFALSSAVDIKFLAPVLAGQRLDYSTVLTHRENNLVRFEVEAFVDRIPVARGRMTAVENVEVTR